MQQRQTYSPGLTNGGTDRKLRQSISPVTAMLRSGANKGQMSLIQLICIERRFYKVSRHFCCNKYPDCMQHSIIPCKKNKAMVGSTAMSLQIWWRVELFHASKYQNEMMCYDVDSTYKQGASHNWHLSWPNRITFTDPLQWCPQTILKKKFAVPHRDWNPFGRQYTT